MLTTALTIGHIQPTVAQQAETPPPASPTTSSPSVAPSHSADDFDYPPGTVRTVRSRQALFWSLILVLIFVIASIAIIRFSVRYRQYLLRKTRPPTPSEDVWQMHKLPREDDLHLPPPRQEDN